MFNQLFTTIDVIHGYHQVHMANISHEFIETIIKSKVTRAEKLGEQQLVRDYGGQARRANCPDTERNYWESQPGLRNQE